MKKEYLMALGAVVIWGTLSPVSKLMFNSMPEMEVLFLASLIATAVLLPANEATGRFSHYILKTWKAKDFAIVCGLGLLGTFAYTALYNYGIARLQAQEACILNYLWPMMIMLFSCLILHEKLTPRKLIAVGFSFFGIFVIVTHFDLRNFRPESPTGVIACLLAAVSYGLFSALNKKFFYDQYPALLIYYFVTMIASGIVTVYQGVWVMPEGIGGAFGIFWLGAVINALGYLLWSQALLSGNTAKVSNLGYITPFLAIVFSRLLLGEPISPFSVLGLAFIILGIFIQMKDRQDAEPA